MPYLRAPYYRRTQNRSDTVPVPTDSVTATIPYPAVDHVYGTAVVGTLTPYYVDKTPTNLLLAVEQEIESPLTDGRVGLQWTDSTDTLYHHRILRKSGNTWYVQGQVAPGTSKFSVSGFTQITVVTLGVQSYSTVDNFTSQITYGGIYVSGSIP